MSLTYPLVELVAFLVAGALLYEAWKEGAYHRLMLALLVGTGVGVQQPEALVGMPLAAISSLFAFRFPRCSHVEG